MNSTISKCIANRGSTLCEVIVSSNERVVPQVKFGRPIEDMDPPFTEERMARYKLSDEVT